MTKQLIFITMSVVISSCSTAELETTGTVLGTLGKGMLGIYSGNYSDDSSAAPLEASSISGDFPVQEPAVNSPSVGLEQAPQISKAEMAPAAPQVYHIHQVFGDNISGSKAVEAKKSPFYVSVPELQNVKISNQTAPLGATNLAAAWYSLINISATISGDNRQTAKTLTIVNVNPGLAKKHWTINVTYEIVGYDRMGNAISIYKTFPWLSTDTPNQECPNQEYHGGLTSLRIYSVTLLDGTPLDPATAVAEGGF